MNQQQVPLHEELIAWNFKKIISSTDDTYVQIKKNKERLQCKHCSDLLI
jgi:hypothetical protein